MRLEIEQHLATCADCREAFERLSDPSGEEPCPDLLQAVLEEAAEWDKRHDSTALQRAVAASIRPYLGAHATDALAETGPEDGRRLLADVEPVLALFLGRRAAGQLVSHVLDRAFVRI